MMKLNAFSWMSLSFFGFYCAHGIFLPFFPAWLKSQQYGAETIGLVLACIYVFRFIGGIFFSHLAKQASHLVNIVRYIAWASVLACVFAGLTAHNQYLLFVAIALFSIFNGAGMPLLDSLATAWQQQIHLDYARARLIGSGAFVVGVVVFGYVIGILGEQNIIWILAAILLGYSLVQMNTPSPGLHDEQESAVQNQVSFLGLLKNKTTLGLMIAVSLIQGSHSAYYAYSTLHWTDNVGLSVSQASWLWGLSVIAEIILFFFSTRLFKNWTVSHLFYLSAVATVLRWIGLVYAESFLSIALVQCLHSLTYAAVHYAMVRYLTIQPQNQIARLQALYSGLSNCAAVALLTALSGVLYNIAPEYAFYAMAATAGTAILFVPRKVSAFLLKRVQ